MIQKTNARHTATSVAAHRHAAVQENSEQHWGNWAGTKHYSLEVIQQPLRARMCGFGDKDRRPLAPAAVAKMTITREDNSVVDVDDIDVAFFIVTVDLWSADGKQEMNLVLHPSSADRYVPTHVTKPRRRTNPSSSVPPVQPPLAAPPAPQYQFPPQSDMSFPPPYADQQPWPYPVDRSLPSIHSFNRPASPAAPSYPEESDPSSSYRAWSSDPSSFHMDPPPHSYDATYTDTHNIYAPACSYAQPPSTSPSNQHPRYSNGGTAPDSPSPSSAPLPRHTYTRTLVGPLSANACRLLDEHRKPGIFFLFQDLSIRTEGTFRLRLRLMNVGSTPAPEPGAQRVTTGSAPILAQTFTDAFVVYSAKRFPGVPDTTALSIAFGNQGQKLPLRNRHGSRQQGRRRRRGDSDGSDDESDGS